MKRLFLVSLVVAAGCDDSQGNVLGGIPSIAYLSRAPTDTGDVFQYDIGGGEANLFTLTPPTASGTRKNLTNWKGADINAFDLSFDAREIVLSARAPGDDRFHIYRITTDGMNPCEGAAVAGPCQITDGPYDEVYPIWLPAGRIFFMTNENVEGREVPQFRDEYERGTTAQVATIDKAGGDRVLGPRNVSHRVAPTLLADGRVAMTEWRHLGDINEGGITFINQDLTAAREGFGREGSGITNSYLRAKEISPGKLVAIGTSRDRTFQSGKLVTINLGGATIDEQSEAKASAQDLTPLVPGDRTPSFDGVGRYYDVVPVGEAQKQQFLVSWSDGYVESELAAMSRKLPDFGIYVFNASSRALQPIVNEVGSWETSPVAIVKRAEPVALRPSFEAQGTQATLISAINVYDSSLFTDLAPGSVKKVRVVEGFSSEEGVPNMFGLSEFDGMARLGDVDLNPDGSFKVLVPANTPVRLQLLDKFGMAIASRGEGGNASEPIWIQGRAGEARVCGGCHEDRTKTLAIAPGSSALQATNAARFDYEGITRQMRKSDVYTEAKVMGVPWNKALQPIFDAKCVSCHNGTPGAANPSYTLTDPQTMTSQTFTFDLRGHDVTINTGEEMYTYSASYVSVVGPEMALRESNIQVTAGTLKIYMAPGNASGSDLIKKLNPPARYPNLNPSERAFGTAVHPLDVGGQELTPDEYYLLILSADNGASFYSRENAQGGMY